MASTLENADGEEQLTVNLDELDCTTFVDVILSLAYTAGQHRTSWRDFTSNLERLRYRSGENGRLSIPAPLLQRLGSRQHRPRQHQGSDKPFFLSTRM